MALDAVPRTLVTTYLHMTSPADFKPDVAGNVSDSVIMMPMTVVDVPFYRFLYNTVGEEWRWRDRRLMSDEELAAVLAKPGNNVYVLYADGVPAGYVELAREGDDTEVAYLGLRPGFIGRGLGKQLLSYGIARAWESGTKRVWVHTCNLDAPGALENYMKRGFSVYKVEEVPMPERYAV
jgi:GNAT superfamily N-acetyltransferase